MDINLLFFTIWCFIIASFVLGMVVGYLMFGCQHKNLSKEEIQHAYMQARKHAEPDKLTQMVKKTYDMVEPTAHNDIKVGPIKRKTRQERELDAAPKRKGSEEAMEETLDEIIGDDK